MVARSIVRSMCIFFLGCVVCCAEGEVLVGETEADKVPQGEAEGVQVPQGEAEGVQVPQGEAGGVTEVLQVKRKQANI